LLVCLSVVVFSFVHFITGLFGLAGFAWGEGFSERINLAVSPLGCEFVFVLLVDSGNFLDIVFVGYFFELFLFGYGFGLIFRLVLFFVNVL
jgi:hypothetical protein